MTEPKAFVVPIRTGEHSTEHWRAWRAEVVGICLVLFGIILSAVAGWPGVAICAIGAWLLRGVAEAYMHSRGGVKAAGVRPSAQQAPRMID